MAIWQFTFHLIPGEAVEQFHGPTALRPIDIETNNECYGPISYRKVPS